MARDFAEICGGPLPNRTSVYLHLEQGLATSLDRPAIISMHQDASYLAELFAGGEKGDARQKLAMCNGDAAEGATATKPLHRHDDSERHDDHEQTRLTVSFRQLQATGVRLASAMVASGVQPDSTMLMLLPNNAEYGILLWTAQVMRVAIACEDTASWDLRWPVELRSRLHALKPSVVAVADRSTAEAVDALVANLCLPQPLRLALSETDAPPGWISLTKFAKSHTMGDIEQDVLLEDARNDNPERLHSVLFTSGTSGEPKGAPLRVRAMTHILHAQAWLMDGRASRRALQQGHPSRAIALSQTLQTWKAGGTVVMSDRGFAVGDIVDAIASLRVTFIVLSPPLVHAMEQALSCHSVDVSCVRTIQIGGDAVTSGVLTKCASLFPRARICINHGMTEGGRAFRWPFFESPTQEIPCYGQMCPVGAVAPGSTVRIWHANEKRRSRKGEAGELHICSDSVIRTYLGTADASAFYEDQVGHWFRTGDIAVMDTEGLVTILGRQKDMIKLTGSVIMPAPLESCIEDHTGKATVVVSVACTTKGSKIIAVVSHSGDQCCSELNAHIRGMLGKQYSLDAVLTLQEIGLASFPVNQTHKIVKARVQEAVIRYLRSTPAAEVSTIRRSTNQE